MTSSDGLSFRIRDLDVLREQVLLVPGAEELVADLGALDEWRASIGVPQFPTAEEAAGVTLPMGDEAVEALERLVSILVFGINAVDSSVFQALAAIAVELDRAEQWPEPMMLEEPALVVYSRLGLLAITSGAVTTVS